MVIFLTFPDDPLAVLRTQKMYISLSCFAYIGTCYVNSQGLWEFVGLEWKLGFVLFLDKNCPASTHLEILVNHRCFMNMCIWPKIGVNIVVIRVYIYIWSIWVWLYVHTQCVCYVYLPFVYPKWRYAMLQKSEYLGFYTQNEEVPEDRQEITSCSLAVTFF